MNNFREEKNLEEGDTLFAWEYEPPRHKKIASFLIPLILIGTLWIISHFWKCGKFLDSLWIVIMGFIFAFFRKTFAFKSQKYMLTTRGVYVFEPNKKNWKRLGYWNEFTDYERSEDYIKLINRGWFGRSYVYFNKNSHDYLQILNVINENIFKRV